MSGHTATDVIIARVAAIICEETCGLTSECKSREAARALMAKGLLSNSHAELVKALERCERLIKEVLPKLQRGSALDSDAVTLLNEVPDEVCAALATLTARKV